VPAGATSPELVCHVDLLATSAAVLGRELPAGAGPDSVSVAPVLLGRGPGRATLIHQAGNPNFLAVRQGPWKLIPPAPGKGAANARNPVPPQPQLFDLSNDLGETKNLAKAHPEKVKELTAVLTQARGAAKD
jgi:arylsulfatase A-like enzyme